MSEIRWQPLEYTVDGKYWLVRSPQMPWCAASGDTLEDAVVNLRSVMVTWLEEFGKANGAEKLAERLLECGR